MSRPIGSKNKPREETTVIEQTKGVVEYPLSTGGLMRDVYEDKLKNPVVPILYDGVFAIRNLRKGQFKGLWELAKLNQDGSVKMILTDANSRGMIITMITREILKIVVQS